VRIKKKSIPNMSYYDAALWLFNEPFTGSPEEKKRENHDFSKPLPDDLQNIKKWSVYLGSNGWVISPLIKISRTPRPWYWAAKRNRYDLIERFFTEQQDNVFSIIRSYLRENLLDDIHDWICEAEDNYISGQFISCAMVLVALFEGCIRQCPISSWRYRVTDFYKDAVENELKVKDNLDNSYMGQILLKTNIHTMYLPSLDSFITRLFIDGEYKLHEGIEPPYLNRNWMMHGMMKRNVTQAECLQMFNALFTLLFIKTYLLENSPYDN
jgi:hypothetical protein